MERIGIIYADDATRANIPLPDWELLANLGIMARFGSEKLADLTVRSDDIFALDPLMIRHTKTAMTICDGAIAYDAAI